MKILKGLFINAVLISFCTSLIAQETEKTDTSNTFYSKYFKNRLYTGGGSGLRFGSITSINLSPIIGYRVHKKVNIGTGVTYLYYHDKNFGFRTHTYGFKLFGNYNFSNAIYAITEYDAINIESYKYLYLNRIWTSGVLAGLGYRENIAAFSSVNIELLWNFGKDQNYPFSNPIIRGTLNIGI